MCMSCGCRQYDAKHDPRAIDWHDLAEAADDAAISPLQAARNILQGAQTLTGDPAAKAGWVLKADDTKRFLLLVAYSANTMPQRGADGYVDVASPEVLEKACWRFAERGLQVGLWHQDGTTGVAKVVENYIWRGEPWTVTGPDRKQQTIREGDWVVGMILDEPTWALYKAGMIGGASPQGRAKRRPADTDLIARMRSAA